jgi:peptide-methionine (S)-S-oxide reductase
MSEGRLETAILGGGCFWCTEAAFDELYGVESVESGYAGGARSNPTYEQVCSGTTGHAEVVKVTFDPSRIAYRDLLEVFFTIHDPTTLNRQGADVGTQYRSVIFYMDDTQKITAETVMNEVAASGVWNGPLVTELSPAPEFFPAEAYHDEYYRRNSNQSYCQVVIAPKLAKLRKNYHARLAVNQPSVPRTEDTPVLPYQTDERNPLDHGGIAD